MLSAALFAITFSNAHGQSVERAPDTLAARVLACASCHGDKGQGTNDDYFPRLAGKPAGYLSNQLVAFRDGRRKYPPVNFLLEFLPDPYLKAMADYFASEQLPFPPPATPTVCSAILARGGMLATKGDPAHATDCMQIVAGHLTEDDVKALAAWLSSRPTPSNPAPAPHGSLPMPLSC